MNHIFIALNLVKYFYLFSIKLIKSNYILVEQIIIKKY
jgi:hypothetical protein